jgi:hypothetical protein
VKMLCIVLGMRWGWRCDDRVVRQFEIIETTMGIKSLKPP